MAKPSAQCDMLMPATIPIASAIVTMIIRPAATANGQSSGAKKALTTALPLGRLGSLQRGEALVDAVCTGHLLQLAQLGGFHIDPGAGDGETCRRGQYTIEGCSGPINLS